MQIEYGGQRPAPADVQIVKVPPAAYVRVLGPSPDNLVEVQLHWTGQRTLPCLGDDCPHHGHPRFWAAYLPVRICPVKMTGVAPARGLLQVTTYLEPLLAGDWSNRVLEIYRKGDPRRGRIYFRVLETLPDFLNDSFDAKPHLERIWQVAHLVRRYAPKTPKAIAPSEPPPPAAPPPAAPPSPAEPKKKRGRKPKTVAMRSLFDGTSNSDGQGL